MSRRFWTDDEIATLCRRYPHEPTKTVAEALSRTLKQVYVKANNMGLHKSAAYLATDASGRVQRGKQDPRMRATQFRKGMTPWNKGSKCRPGRGGNHHNAQRTQFKKGQMSGAAQHNYVPIGTERVTRDGSLERKVTDDQSVYPARRWVSVARLVWEAEHGPIPAGHIVRFKHGMHTTEAGEITADKLECISKAENMRRNTYHRYPQPIPKLIQLRGALTRKINNREKNAS